MKNQRNKNLDMTLSMAKDEGGTQVSANMFMDTNYENQLKNRRHTID